MIASMIEVTGDDITHLNDSDLRTLVARLALSELRAQGCPISSVTAGGNQDAADGGIDVSVDCPNSLSTPDFVPRPRTGFQVKKPDMPRGKIKDEMRPDNVLRPAIADLAASSGAYIIVSAKGSVAHAPLADRRQAIRDQLHGLIHASDLYADFYDRNRLATWVNEYSGVAAWVRDRIGYGLSGWSSVGAWVGSARINQSIYLFDDKACLCDELSHEHEQLTLDDGVTRLRTLLCLPRQCVRLIGLSGVGKTRLVEALFDDSVGAEPLDMGIAVYTDYSVETDPTARDMARQLSTSGQRSILIIDNCNPGTHSELVEICTSETSNVSLLTIEYDVGDDEPEHTAVFRLQSASPDLVSKWLEETFPHVSQIDRRTIATFSDGNFKVANALAETISKGESLGTLKSQNLFERIFRQRNNSDPSLFDAAQELSLFYSVEGEDCSERSELAQISAISTAEPRELYRALIELHDRGVVQSRGRWRAILPHAIANRLAASALKRIPPSELDNFCASLPPRMLKSVSRRLGYLHDSLNAQAIATRWLDANGPLGDIVANRNDGIGIITNIAPVAPEAVLEKIQRELDGPIGDTILAPDHTARGRWIRLIKLLAYEHDMFERSVILLARFVAAEPENHNVDSARNTFSDLFHLTLSGTRASPKQRRDMVRELANSQDPATRRCASIGLDALLKVDHFSSSGPFDFGSRSRGFGWEPKVNRDIWNWINAATELAVELDGSLYDARGILGRNVRAIWSIHACRDTLEQAAHSLISTRSWIEGWKGFRGARRFEGQQVSDDERVRLENIIQRLEPSILLDRARAIVVNGAFDGWDLADNGADSSDAMKYWHRVAQAAQDIGRALAQDPPIRKTFLEELFQEKSVARASECGQGLASGASDLSSLWRELGNAFLQTDPEKRNPTVLGGFLHNAYQLNPEFTVSVLDDLIDHPDLGAFLPYFQARVGLGEDGIERLRRAVSQGAVEASAFHAIANGVVDESPADNLANLLLDIGNLRAGADVALDVLHMRFFSRGQNARPSCQSLIDAGRVLLPQVDYSNVDNVRDFGLRTVIRLCCSGNDGQHTAREVCASISESFNSFLISLHNINDVLKALFETQPLVALDMLLASEDSRSTPLLLRTTFDAGTPIEGVDVAVLRKWANQDTADRYELLSKALPMFRHQQGEEVNQLSPLFLAMLDTAPYKKVFLGNFQERLRPLSWTGSLADVLSQRRTQIAELYERPYVEVQEWIDDGLPKLDRWTQSERARDTEKEERFE